MTKFLDWLKLKAFADNHISVTEKLKIVLGKEENNVGKGEKEKMLVTSIFSFSHNVFQKASFSRSFKAGIVQ